MEKSHWVFLKQVEEIRKATLRLFYVGPGLIQG